MKQVTVLDVKLEDIAKATTSIPGEGVRILVCLHGLLNMEGSDGATIVAMAETQEDLHAAVQAEGIRYEETLMPSGFLRREAVTETGVHQQGYIAVVDTPIAAIRSLRLSSEEELRRSLQEITDRVPTVAHLPG